VVQSAQGESADGGQVRLGAGGGRRAGTGRCQPHLGSGATGSDESRVSVTVTVTGQV